MPHNVASDQGLHCSLTGFSIKKRIKVTNRPNTPKMTNGLIQHIIVEETTSIQWVNATENEQIVNYNNIISSEQLIPTVQ